MSQAKCNAANGCPPSVPLSKFDRDEDYGPATSIAIWLLTGTSAVFLSLRLYCKFIRHRRLHLDDWVLVASWLATLAGTICTTVAIGYGFGKRGYEIPFDNFGSLIMAGLLSVTFDIIGQAWSKTSFAITILHISEGKVRVFIWFAIISMNILMGLAAMSYWVQCSPIEKSWKPLVPGTCWDPRVAIVYGIVAGGKFIPDCCNVHMNAPCAKPLCRLLWDHGPGSSHSAMECHHGASNEDEREAGGRSGYEHGRLCRRVRFHQVFCHA
jgi:hypothetical protein